MFSFALCFALSQCLLQLKSKYPIPSSHQIGNTERKHRPVTHLLSIASSFAFTLNVHITRHDFDETRSSVVIIIYCLYLFGLYLFCLMSILILSAVSYRERWLYEISLTTGIYPMCILVKSSHDLNVTSAQKSEKHLIPCAGLNLTLQSARNKQWNQ